MLKSVFRDNTDNALTRACVYEWNKRYSGGVKENEDDKHLGRLVTSRSEGEVLNI